MYWSVGVVCVLPAGGVIVFECHVALCLTFLCLNVVSLEKYLMFWCDGRSVRLFGIPP